MTERELQDAVLKIARLYKWRAFHAYDARRSTAGFPDLTLVKNGRLVFLELKVDRNRITPAQADWLGDLSTVPGVTAWQVRPVDLQLVADLLAAA